MEHMPVNPTSVIGRLRQIRQGNHPDRAKLYDSLVDSLFTREELEAEMAKALRVEAKPPLTTHSSEDEIKAYLLGKGMTHFEWGRQIGREETLLEFAMRMFPNDFGVGCISSRSHPKAFDAVSDKGSKMKFPVLAEAARSMGLLEGADEAFMVKLIGKGDKVKFQGGMVEVSRIINQYAFEVSIYRPGRTMQRVIVTRNQVKL